MAISHSGSTAISTATAARGTTAAFPSYPAGVAAGRIAIMSVSVKPGSNGAVAPFGWTEVGNASGGTGTNAADTGPTRICIFYRILDGTETGGVTVSTGGTSIVACINIFQGTLGGWAAPTAVFGDDATHGTNPSATCGTWSQTPSTGDMLLIAYSADTDATNAASAPTISQTGFTFNTPTARSRQGNSDGNDNAVLTWSAPVTGHTAGSLNAPTVGFTWAASSCGPFAVVRLHEVAAISTVTDNFDDGTATNPPWADNYGGVTETGGRAQTPATTGYSGYNTSYNYSLDTVYVRAYPAAVNGATTGEVYSALWMNSITQGAGNQIGFKVDTLAGTISFENQSAYFDADKVTLTYDPSAHAWWRLQHTGGNLVWSTSPDGATWTTQRTLAAPAYVAGAKDFRLSLEAHRDSGTNNVAEWDNLNVVSVVTHDATGTSAGAGASSGSLDRSTSASGTSAGVSSSSGTSALTTAVSGTSAGVATSSGSLGFVAAVSGSSAGAGGTNGTLSPTRVTSGSSAGTGASSGSALVDRGVSGTSVGTSSSSGSTSAVLVASGSSAGAGSSSGSAAADRTLGAGSSAGAGASTGAASVTGNLLPSTSDGTGDSTGTLSVTRQASGTSAGVGGSTGTAVRTVAVSGTSAGLGASASTPSITAAVTGSSAGLGATSGSATNAYDLAGTSAGVATSSGSMSAARELDGASTGSQSSSGSSSLLLSLAGTSVAAGDSTGLLLTGGDLYGASAGEGPSSGSAVVTHVATGASAGVGSSSGSGAATKDATGTSAGTAASSGTALRAIGLDGTSAGVGGSSGSVGTAGQIREVDGEATGQGVSQGQLGVERNLTGSSAGVGASSDTLDRILGLIGVSAGIGGSSVSLSMVYAASGVTAAVQTSTGLLTVTSPLQATSDLVIANWLKTAAGIDPTKVAATLPANVDEWGEVGFVQARTVGGEPDIDLPVQRPVVQIDVWAVKPNTGKPLWNVANVLAMQIIEATRDEAAMRRELVLPTGYPRARVLECYPLTEPYRVESDPGSYARFRFDVRFHWVVVS